MDRRPISARQSAWAQRLADVLARGGVTPNRISVWGMAFGISSGMLLSCTRTNQLVIICWLGGAALAGLRLLANLLDGMVAERLKKSSAVGSLFNEVPDRVSDAAILLGLGYAQNSLAWLGWLAALLAIMTAYVRAQLAVAGAPQDFGGPMAKPHRMVVVIAAAVIAAAGKLLGLGTECVPEIALGLIVAGSAITVLRRLWRGAGLLQGKTA